MSTDPDAATRTSSPSSLRAACPAADDMALETGHVLAGRFRIEREAGRGGLGRVYRARDQELERDVAIKVVRAHSLVTPQQEARRMADVHGEGVVDVYDVRLDSDPPFLVLEWVEDGDLGSWLSRHGKCTPEETRRLAQQVLHGLSHIHGRRLLHLDVKPGNILVAPEPSGASTPRERLGRVKLADFGMLPLVGAGTPLYRAPEQARVTPFGVGPRADLFAVGLVLYEALTGSRARLTPDEDVVCTHLWERPEARSVPRAWCRAIERLLEPDPSQRPASADEALRLIPEARLRAPLRKAALVLLTGLVLLGAVGAWLTWTSPSSALVAGRNVEVRNAFGRPIWSRVLDSQPAEKCRLVTRLRWWQRPSVILGTSSRHADPSAPEDGTVYCFDASGSERWRTPIGGTEEVVGEGSFFNVSGLDTVPWPGAGRAVIATAYNFPGELTQVFALDDRGTVLACWQHPGALKQATSVRGPDGPWMIATEGVNNTLGGKRVFVAFDVPPRDGFDPNVAWEDPMAVSRDTPPPWSARASSHLGVAVARYFVLPRVSGAFAEVGIEGGGQSWCFRLSYTGGPTLRADPRTGEVTDDAGAPLVPGTKGMSVLIDLPGFIQPVRDVLVTGSPKDLARTLALADDAHVHPVLRAIALLQLGERAARDGDVPEAIGELERATRLDPEQWGAWERLGDLEALSGRNAEAERAYRTCHDGGGDNDLVTKRLGDLALLQDDPAKAAELYTQVVHPPRRAASLLLTALAENGRGDVDATVDMAGDHAYLEVVRALALELSLDGPGRRRLGNALMGTPTVTGEGCWSQARVLADYDGAGADAGSMAADVAAVRARAGTNMECRLFLPFAYLLEARALKSVGRDPAQVARRGFDVAPGGWLRQELGRLAQPGAQRSPR